MASMPSHYRSTPTGSDGGADPPCRTTTTYTHHVNNNCKYETPSSLQLINPINTAAATPPHIIHNTTNYRWQWYWYWYCRIGNGHQSATSTYSVPSSEFYETTIVEKTTSRNNNRPKPVATPSRASWRMISLYCWLLVMPWQKEGVRGHLTRVAECSKRVIYNVKCWCMYVYLPWPTIDIIYNNQPWWLI